jgi:hypothetical protein
VLHVSDATASGVPNEASRAIYRDFLRNLHDRLAGARVSFTAGCSQARYRVVLGAAILLGLILVATLSCFSSSRTRRACSTCSS